LPYTAIWRSDEDDNGFGVSLPDAGFPSREASQRKSLFDSYLAPYRIA
jgi:hypothetical protein